MEIEIELWSEFESYIEEALERNPNGVEIDAREIASHFHCSSGFYSALLRLARRLKPGFSISKGYAGWADADDFSIVFERINCGAR